MENKKVSDALLGALREVQAQYDFLTKRVGELTYEMEIAKRSILEVEDRRLASVRAIEEELGAEAGSGNIDLETGEFIPN